jgi:hypothetical protein
MAGDIVTLRSTLETLARTTWSDIAAGRQLGVEMGEVGITDHNMLALRREHPSLLVHKHAINEEVRTGADWEWWLGSNDGWLCIVFQAKLLNVNGRYAGITKGQREGKPQVDLLLRSCLRRSERLNGAVWPMYCFYNSWQGTWPESVSTFDGADPRLMSDEELQLYGCTVADAWSVRQVLFSSSYSMRRTLRNSYLPMSRPWSMIFPSSAESATETMKTLSSWILGQAQLRPALPQGKRREAELERARPLGDRMAIYRDPTLVNQPPEYVRDLMQGRVQSRRLKPLARRVVILPEYG